MRKFIGGKQIHQDLFNILTVCPVCSGELEPSLTVAGENPIMWCNNVHEIFSPKQISMGYKVKLYKCHVEHPHGNGRIADVMCLPDNTVYYWERGKWVPAQPK